MEVAILNNKTKGIRLFQELIELSAPNLEYHVSSVEKIKFAARICKMSTLQPVS